MTSDDLLRALLDPDAELPEDQALCAALARAARARRAQEEGGLAHGEWADGAHYDDDEAREQSRDPAPTLRLAAAPTREAAPLRYTAEGWTLLLAPRPDGGWSALLAGPEAASLELPGEVILLTPRTWAPLRLASPPSLALLRLADGRVLALERTRSAD